MITNLFQALSFSRFVYGNTGGASHTGTKNNYYNALCVCETLCNKLFVKNEKIAYSIYSINNMLCKRYSKYTIRR